MRRFKKFYPDEFSKLKVVINSDRGKTADFFRKMGIPVYAYYKDLNYGFRDIIPGWE
jgi:hypothetical protein